MDVGGLELHQLREGGCNHKHVISKPTTTAIRDYEIPWNITNHNWAGPTKYSVGFRQTMIDNKRAMQ